MKLPSSNCNNSSIASTSTILLRPMLIRKIKKKGSQLSAVVAESLGTSDFRALRVFFYSLRDINTPVSTCHVCGNISNALIDEISNPASISFARSLARVGGSQET